MFIEEMYFKELTLNNTRYYKLSMSVLGFRHTLCSRRNESTTKDIIFSSSIVVFPYLNGNVLWPRHMAFTFTFMLVRFDGFVRMFLTLLHNGFI